VDLLESDADATDFFLPNGAFTDTKYELISYLTDSTRNGDSTRYSAPATALPKSETHSMLKAMYSGMFPQHPMDTSTVSRSSEICGSASSMIVTP
jgi:hypothetical protein